MSRDSEFSQFLDLKNKPKQTPPPSQMGSMGESQVSEESTISWGDFNSDSAQEAPKSDNLQWSDIVSEMEKKIPTQAFSTWIEPIVCKEIHQERIELLVPSDFFKTWIQDSFLEMINQIIFQKSGRHLFVDMVVDPSIATNQTPIDQDQEPRVSQPASAPNFAGHGQVIQLNPKYRFDNFIVGSSNQIAHAAANRVAESPGQSYNPLFIYSQAGLGKTHLLHAIGNTILRTKPDHVVYYISSEKFVNELIESIKTNNMSKFRSRYRDNIDVLLIDDIQFIGRKERTQEEFFHTFNYLYNAKKQIVFTSDRPPKEIEGLEERLRTRFEWGLMADIQTPEIETRIAILKHKAEIDDIYLPDDVALLIANNVKTNIRELEGCLVRLGAYASITSTEINVEMAREVLKDVLDEDAAPELNLDSILKTAANFFRVKVTDVKGKSRLKEYTIPRQITMYLARKLTQKSFKEIGSFFGGRDHSTVMHAVAKIEMDLESNPKLRRDINEIESNL